MVLSMAYIENNYTKWQKTPIDNMGFLDKIKDKYKLDDYSAAVILSNALYEEHNKSKDKDIKIMALEKWLRDAREKADYYNTKYLTKTQEPFRENLKLKSELKHAQIKIKLLLEMLRMSEGELQVEYLRQGGKIARKEHVTKELVEQLIADGSTIAEIAKQQDVSVSTIYRRLHEDNPMKKNDGPFED